ncbi:unnamed protein product [Phytophthora fragariaefolia]|uniref:Unnamed protein product n=1 Tax=Phytophthora fragariaefolia TaxID=1490495 RepID=A0A9W6XIQ9_9STRA|nr:unnamed protein product [Phytophthora fragariaefolia]
MVKGINQLQALLSEQECTFATVPVSLFNEAPALSGSRKAMTSGDIALPAKAEAAAKPPTADAAGYVTHLSTKKKKVAACGVQAHTLPTVPLKSATASLDHLAKTGAPPHQA